MKSLVAVIGHSVVRDGERFRSSGLVQEIARTSDGRILRTGIFVPELDWDSERAYLGGGEAVVLAVSRAAQDRDALIIGGRPKYLEEVAKDQPEISEGLVMEEEIKAFGILPVGRIEHTRTTADEAKELLMFARDYGYQSVEVLMLAFRIPRFALLLELVAGEHSMLTDTYARTAIVPAEQYLPEIAAQFARLSASRAYRFTVDMERQGMRKLLIGTYKAGGTT